MFCLCPEQQPDLTALLQEQVTELSVLAEPQLLSRGNAKQSTECWGEGGSVYLFAAPFLQGSKALVLPSVTSTTG